MNNELEQHKNGDKIKWILTLIAFILIGVMFVGVIFGMTAIKAKNDKKDEDTETVNGTSLFTNYSAQTVELNRSGIVL